MRIPALAHGLHLSDGMLGLALLATPAGSVAVAPIAGALVDRVGSRLPTLFGGLVVPVLPVFFGLAPDQIALMAAMFVFGLAAGLLDVSMNAQAVQLQQLAGRQLMTSMHACFSFGALGGGLIGGAFAWANVHAAPDFAVVATPLVLLAGMCGRFLLAPARALPAGADGQASRASSLDGGAEEGGVGDSLAEGGVAEDGSAEGGLGEGRLAEDGATGADGAQDGAADERGVPSVAGTRQFPRLAPLAVLSLLALCSLLGEGAADGWSAVYLRDNLAASAGFAAMGYAAFALTMASGRLVGDRLADRFGAVALLRAGGLLAAAGMAAVVLAAAPVGALIGFAVYGAGLSCTFPQLIVLAGDIRPDRPGRAIGRVAGTGYAGLVAGPVLIGGLASVAGLTAALGVPALLALGIAAGAGSGVRRSAQPQSP